MVRCNHVMDMITRKATFQPATVNAEARTVNLVLSTGARVLRERLFDEPVFEELSLDPAHVDLDRLNNGAPLLNSHRRFDLADQMGVLERAWIENGVLHGTARFSDRPEVDPYFRDVQAGIIRNVSLGYVVHQWRDITQPDDAHPVQLAIRWEPFEASLVTIGADAGAQTRNLEADMPKEQNTQERADRGPNAASAVERKRCQEIIKSVRAAKLSSDLADELIAEGLPLDKARERIINAWADEGDNFEIRSAVHPVPGNQNFENPEFRVQAMAEALASRYVPVAPSEAAREFTGMRILDMARYCLEAQGVSTRMMPANRVMERALAGHTTSDFPQLLTATGDRMLRSAYDAAPAGLKTIGRRTTAMDFRAKSRLQLGEAPALLEVKEAGEFQRGTMAEAKESYQLATYGRMFGLSRQALVNDDLGAFADASVKFGRAAAEFEAQFLVTLFTSQSGAGPDMHDGTALFDASHSNLAGTGAAPSVTTLGAARQAMRLQKGLDGSTPINTAPRFLMVPAALETTAEQLVAQITAMTASDVNPFSGRLEVVVEPRLDAVSATAWYLAGDPAVIDGLEYAYLEQANGPEFFIREGWDVDGVEFKIRLDFGAGLLDWRGFFKNAGA